MGRFHSFLSGQRIDESTPAPYLLRSRSSKFFIILTVSIAVFTDIFLYAVIVPVIPFALSARVGIPDDEVQHWVSILLAVYGAALLVASPLAGWYADNSSSRRMPLLIGLLALAGSTVMLCLARSVALLVVGRILQGLAAGTVWTVGTALLVDTVGQAEVGQVMGYVSISMSMGILLGPLLGGVIYDKAGYYAVFYVSFGFIFLDIILRLALIEKKIAAQWMDVEPPLRDTVFAEPPIEKLDVNEDGHASPEPSPPAIIEVSVPRKASKYPPVLTLLKSRRLLAALWGCLIQASLMTAFDSVVPLFVQRTFGWDSVGAGLVFLALMIPNFLAPIVGALSDNYGPRWLTVCGFIAAIPFWVLLRLVTENTLKQKVLLCALLALIGTCLMIVISPLMAEITYIVEAKERKTPGVFGKQGAYAQAYGLFITAFAVGTLVGPIWSGYVVEAAGWGTMSWTLGLFSAMGAVPALIWTGGLITNNNAKTGKERAMGKAASAQRGLAEEEAAV